MKSLMGNASGRLTLLIWQLFLPAVLVAQETVVDLVPESFQIPSSDAGLPGVGPIRRYDWFQKLWQSKRSGWAKRIEQDRGAVVFLGNSITQGWGDDLGGNFEGMKVANRGISGDTTRGMLLRLEDDVLSLHPSGVVLLMGTNDLEEAQHPIKWLPTSS